MLELWRTIEPRRLMLEIDPGTLLAFLVSVTEPADAAARRWKAAAMSGNSHAALPLAAALRAAHALPDLAPTWLLWASLDGNLAAQLALAQTLLHLDLYPMTQAERRDAHRRRRLGLAWLEALHLPRLTEPSGWDRLIEVATRMPWTAAATVQRPPPSSWDGPSLQVVTEIGDAASREGQQLSRVYAGLCQPMPLRGGTISPDALATALRLEFPNFGPAIDQLIGDFKLQLRLGRPWLRCQPLLLVGPPGVGKTRFCHRFASMAGLGFGELSAAGAADTRALMGTARGWSSAQPCLPLLTIKRSESANPIFVIDEIEKAGTSRHHGHLHDALLQLLERESATRWFDEALLAEADLSQVTWLLCANETNYLPSPLLSRVHVVSVTQPPASAADAVVESLLRDIAADYDVQPLDLPPINDDAYFALTQALIKGRSPRCVRRAITAALKSSLKSVRCN